MYSARIIFTALQRTALLMVLAALAACGGSEDEQPCSQTLAVLTAGLCLLGEVTYSSAPSSQPCATVHFRLQQHTATAQQQHGSDAPRGGVRAKQHAG